MPVVAVPPFNEGLKPDVKDENADADDDEELRTVIINVSGVRHEVSTRTLRDLPPTARLANLDTVQRHYR